MNRQLTRKQFWALCAAFGALWGAVEVTIGAYGHSLHLPFTGLTLATFGAALLVAQRQIFPTRGLTLGTALLAALTKSMSSGGIILGPMLGMMMEGLLVEIALFAAPRSRLAGATGVGLAALWAVSQKFVLLFALYGVGLLDLYQSAGRAALDALGLGETGVAQALAIAVAALFAGAGAVGLLGHSVGTRAAARLREAKCPDGG